MSEEDVKVKCKDAKKEDTKESEKKEESVKKSVVEAIKPKFGPTPWLPYQKIWTRTVFILGVMVVVWFNSKDGKEIALAKRKDVLVNRVQNVDCAADYKAELDTYPGCVPEKCGRAVSDKLVTATEADVLLKIAANGMKMGGSSGGATILDLHSGALSKDTGLVNFYSLEGAEKIINSADFAIYKVVKTKIHHAIAHNFGVDANKIYLTKPTFFSRMTNRPAKTIHDQYWLPHVDKVSYEFFHYTSLLYLSDYGRDFKGGRFVFIDKNNVNSTVEPKKGRVSMFTSGGENLHMVEHVVSGTRYALTVSFTCEQNAAISDPHFIKVSKND